MPERKHVRFERFPRLTDTIRPERSSCAWTILARCVRPSAPRRRTPGPSCLTSLRSFLSLRRARRFTKPTSQWRPQAFYVSIFNRNSAAPAGGSRFRLTAKGLACGGDIRGECFGNGVCTPSTGKCTCDTGYDLFPDCSVRTVVRGCGVAWFAVACAWTTQFPQAQHNPRRILLLLPFT